VGSWGCVQPRAGRRVLQLLLLLLLLLHEATMGAEKALHPSKKSFCNLRQSTGSRRVGRLRHDAQ